MQNLLRNAMLCFAAMCGAASLTANEAQAQRVFPSAQAAADELVAAARAARPGFAIDLFGPRGRQLVSTGDVERDRERLRQFVDAAASRLALEDKDANTKVLIIGERAFPFPIPIARKGDGWAFDPVAGQREIRARLIGHNELAAMSACLAFMDAQRDYIKADRDGDRVLEYAQRIVSRPGLRDGLYWDPSSQSDISPLEGALSDAVRAAREGTPSYEGYVFRILRRQGPSAPGGAYDYIINGNMIGGHALIAHPLKWGETGVMTFMCSHHGDMYEKNLGADTSRLANRSTSYNPGSTWRLVD